MVSGYAELLECGHGPIVDMAMKCEGVLSTHERALVSISGGADSDVMMDVCERVRAESGATVDYVFFDTGLEYRATREHIGYLEERYGVSVRHVRPDVTLPVSCKRFGQPFVSKNVSAMCERLQSIGFAWEDEPYDALLGKYGTGQTSALKWWSNGWTRTDEPGWFDIGRNRWLREFMVEHPPTFAISAKCCDYTKKDVSHRVERDGGYDVKLIGVRRAEGGVRAAHKTCVTRDGTIDTYRPLFWLSNADRARYVQLFGIRHSACYEVWGMTRTGCAGCPFGRDRLRELSIIGQHEPAMARACKRIFRDSYEYTARYRAYQRRMDADERGQLAFDF